MSDPSIELIMALAEDTLWAILILEKRVRVDLTMKAITLRSMKTIEYEVKIEV